MKQPKTKKDYLAEVTRCRTESYLTEDGVFHYEAPNLDGLFQNLSKKDAFEVLEVADGVDAFFKKLRKYRGIK